MLALKEMIVTRLGHTAQVVETEMVTERMKRIRLGGKGLINLDWQPGQHVRLSVGSGLRTYSVWQYQPQEGLIDLCILLHAGGPGTQWATSAKPGDSIAFIGPQGKFVVKPTPSYYLFAGEETGAVAIQTICRALPTATKIYGCLEGDTSEDKLPDLDRSELNLPWVYRNGKPASPESGLVEAVRKLALPAAPGVAYLAGETKTCQALRNYLIKERNWPASSVNTKPFWQLGRTGLD